jgi:CRP/FNR family cyclic AMP-dependent transcriptional regulator
MLTVRVSDEDPDLFSGVGDPAAAAAASIAETRWLEIGDWRPGRERVDTRAHYGFLILDGMLLRRVALGVRDSIELLGPGDVARPWVDFGAGSAIGTHVRWTVHQRVRIANLDRRWAVRVATWPEVSTALMDRAMRRQRFLAMHAAISQMPKLQSRLLVLFWYLADRWGRMTSDGVMIDVPLTHELVAGIVGARRPGVTSALGELQRTGDLGRRDDGRWVLRGDPPSELSLEHPDRERQGVG